MLTREQWDALVKRARLKAGGVNDPLISRYFFGVMNEEGVCRLFELLDLGFLDILHLLEETDELVVAFPTSIVNALGAERICGCDRRETPTLLTRKEVVEHVEVILDRRQPDKIVVVEWGARTDVLSVPRRLASHYLRRRMRFHDN